MQGLKRINPLNKKKIIVDSGPLATLLCSFGRGYFETTNTQKVAIDGIEFIFYKKYGEKILQILSLNSLIVTPHVISEISNHLKRKNIRVSDIFNDKNPVVQLLQKNDERHVKLPELLQTANPKQHIDYGVTDFGLLYVTKSVNGFLFTDDGSLVAAAKKSQIRTFNSKGIFQESGIMLN